jgi:diguanylate cyclase (GGDEF)-like protein/PAS domain S-box-containing protein
MFHHKAAGHLPFWAIRKTFLAIFLSLELCLVVFFLAFYFLDMRAHRTLLTKSELSHVESQKRIINYEFKQILKNLLFLAESRNLIDFLDHGGESRRQDLSQSFLRFCARQEIFDQVRYLDDSGKEVVRVNFNQGHPEIIPENQLQSKAKRYYFLDAIGLARDEVFVSPFDLNIEGGKLERPLKPMIRFATPVFDSQGQKRGIIIFNFLGKEIIENLRQTKANANAPGQIMLLNAAGYWLYSPIPGEAWGFMFKDKKNLTFGKAHPEAWKIISAAERGQFQDAGSLYTFVTVYPLQAGLSSSIGTDKAEGESARTLETRKYQWKLVSYISPKIWRERSQYLANRIAFFFGFLTLLFAAISWVISRNRLRRLQAEEANIRLASIVESSDDAIIGKTLNGTITSWNHGAERVYGYAADEVLGKHISLLVLPDKTDELSEALQKIRQGQRVEQLETVRVRKDGRRIDVSLTISTIKDAKGKIIGVSTIARDITRQKQADEALKKANDQLQAMVETSVQRHREVSLINGLVEALQTCHSAEEAYPIIAELAQQLFALRSGALFILDPDSNLLEAVAHWGDSLAGEEVFAPDDCWAIRSGRMHFSEGSFLKKGCCLHYPVTAPACYLCIPLTAQGETIGLLHIQTAVEVDASVMDMTQNVAVIVGDNISLALANIRLRETLRHQVMHDALTGLFNRRYLDVILKREIARLRRKKAPLGVIMMDLDHFKLFNDTHGHEAGDCLLEAMGKFLASHIRQEDIACRYGGEEFVLILPEASLDVTLKRAEEIRQGVAQLHVSHRGQVLNGITVSLGVAILGEHGANGEDLLRAADNAMYRAKEQGRNRALVADGSIEPSAN